METPNDSHPLPAVIAAYWAAANAGRVADAAACFAPEAVVQDEGQRHVDSAAIAAWITATTQKYHPVVTPLRCEEKSGRTHVAARVSGSFPGSPLEFEFVFSLRADRIAELAIA